MAGNRDNLSSKDREEEEMYEDIAASERWAMRTSPKYALRVFLARK